MRRGLCARCKRTTYLKSNLPNTKIIEKAMKSRLDNLILNRFCARAMRQAQRGNCLPNVSCVRKWICARYAPGRKILAGADGRLAIQPHWQDCQRSNESKESKNKRKNKRSKERRKEKEERKKKERRKKREERKEKESNYAPRIMCQV